METITGIINEWDPIGFFPMAPQDEYINEVEKIYRFLSQNISGNVEQLARVINEIFLETFGDDIYEEDMQSCKGVAEKLLKEFGR
ncbi:MAG: DUF1871 family protein [Lachnospiraceae bacterium]|nr:DUF1871 family protein [Lachnospiraceae bacterium]